MLVLPIRMSVLAILSNYKVTIFDDQIIIFLSKYLISNQILTIENVLINLEESRLEV